MVENLVRAYLFEAIACIDQASLAVEHTHGIPLIASTESMIGLVLYYEHTRHQVGVTILFQEQAHVLLTNSTQMTKEMG